MTLKTIEGTFIAPKGKFALVVGRFNSFVVESLVSGAIDALDRGEDPAAYERLLTDLAEGGRETAGAYRKTWR